MNQMTTITTATPATTAGMSVPPPTNSHRHELVINEAGLQAARKSLHNGAVTPACGPHYARHDFMATGLASPKIAGSGKRACRRVE